MLPVSRSSAPSSDLSLRPISHAAAMRETRQTMRATTQAALENGVRVGAHPSYPDRKGFGRRPMDITPRDLSSALVSQIGALMEVASSLGATVQSIKPHGALYGEVGRGTAACEALLTVILELCGPEVSLVLPSGAAAVAIADDAGLCVLREGFADRAYVVTGELASRHEPGSVYSEPSQAATQALGLVLHGTVTLGDGTVLSLPVDTLCIHGDSPDAPSLARAVGEVLAEAGVIVVAPSSARR